MGNSLAGKLNVGVNLPGTRGVKREIPQELLGATIDKVIQYVIDGNLNGNNAMVAKAISREIKGGTVYTIFVAKGNEQYSIDRTRKIDDLFEITPGKEIAPYQELNFTVSRPREGGFSKSPRVFCLGLLDAQDANSTSVLT